MNVSVKTIILILLYIPCSVVYADVDAGEFAFNNMDEPETLDPALMTGIWEHTIALALYEGLTVPHPETLQPQPGVAKTWKVSDGGTRYTFTLRKDAKWSNGESVTASDFYYACKRVLEPKTAAPYAYHLFHIKNAKYYNSGTIKDFSKVGISVKDAYTLEVRLINPTPYFLFLTTFYTLSPVHRKTLERYHRQWTRPTHIVTNGPFHLKKWKPHEYMLLEKSPTYWDKNSVRLQRLRILPVSNKEAALNLYRKGKLQWTGHGLLPESRIPMLKKRGDYRSPERLGTYFLRLNVNRPPLDNIDVRKALYLAINI